MDMGNMKNNPSGILHAPSNFRVIAIIATFNEEDVIVPIIHHLNNQGVNVYIIDNWSTDSTYELVQQIETGVIGVERWPALGPSGTYDWGDLLKRKEELSQELDADWFIHNDADEICESPWKDIPLKDALCIVDQLGFNAIDYAVLEFQPVDNGYKQGSNLIEYFQYYFFDVEITHYYHTNTWKNLGIPINLSDTGGHTINFKGRKVFPYQFILKHYPIRSQAHGERKIHRERQSRYNPLEREKGWHVQYDRYPTGTNFIKNPDKLIKFDAKFYNEFLVNQMIHHVKSAHSPDSQVDGLMARLRNLQKQYHVPAGFIKGKIKRLLKNIGILKSS
jgi:glycosyltransferase involved in cell wall biosynthesis